MVPLLQSGLCPPMAHHVDSLKIEGLKTDKRIGSFLGGHPQKSSRQPAGPPAWKMCWWPAEAMEGVKAGRHDSFT